tara:strand:- start:31 stop:729 length:699 start_codon:yes stop_codon:yes gene_type:complete
MKDIVIYLSLLAGILFSQLYSQTGGGTLNLPKLFKNTSLLFGYSQSYYGEDLEDYKNGIAAAGNIINDRPYRKFNFGLMKESENKSLSGFKYISYGYDFQMSTLNIEDVKNEIIKLNVEFLKYFWSQPIGRGIYLGLEIGYFIEGNSFNEVDQGSTASTSRKLTKNDWESKGLSLTDYGLLIQYYYNIGNRLLFLSEGYYGLSKFSDKIFEITKVPNTFKYINIGIIYKIGK